MLDPAVMCLRCAADVSAFPPSARYCSRCGFQLPWRAPKPHPLPASVAPPVSLPSPPFLLTYGRALFNLGWRYETAVGSRRNPNEALRCYGKAARLGDALAIRRLTPSGPIVPPPFANLFRPPVG